MFLFDWLKGILNSLGLAKKSGKILFLGLDNAGKTTLLRRLKDDRMVQHTPTLYAHMEELTLGNINLKAYDLGGHKAARRAWKNYTPKVDGIIYMVDTCAHNRFGESKEELDALLEQEELANVPVVILGNKIDLKEAASEEEIRAVFGLDNNNFGPQHNNSIGDRPIQVFMCSVSKKVGYADGFKWLGQFLK